jgi:hypothetical protein
MFTRSLRLALGIALISGTATQMGAQTDQEIRIGKPKIWRYDRMYPVLDGLLRDVEGTSLASLSSLDASAVNSRVVDLLQSYFNASVSVDQAAGITNGISLDTFTNTRKAQMSTLQQQATATQNLAQERAALVQSLTAAMDAKSKRAAALPPGTACEADAECTQDQATMQTLSDELTQLQTASGTAPTPTTVAPPTLDGVTASGPGTVPTIGSGINPTDFISKALAADPQQVGSLPAREKLDAFITLLNDRLTKQLALSLDEEGLGGHYVPFVIEFDVSIEPNSSRNNQEASASFVISGNCAGRSTVVYNIYPSMAAFNVAAVSGSSNGFYLNGAFKGLFVGSNVGYQRQKDHISQAMRQSVYISGFRAGASTVGWYYGPPSYTTTVRTGEYSTFAVILVPKQTDGSACPFSIKPTSYWRTSNGHEKSVRTDWEMTHVTNSEMLSEHTPYIRQVQYFPHYGSPDALNNDVNIIAVEFEDPVDPNLLLTASGKLIKRARDWRGRATSPGTSDTISITNASGSSVSVSRERGLLEADIDDADTWIAVSQTKILIKLSYAVAQSTSFPDIQVLIPGKEGWDLRGLVDYRTYEATITIGDRNFRACHPKFAAYSSSKKNQGCMPQPRSMWVPLFSLLPSPNHSLRVITAAANVDGLPQDAPDNSAQPGSQIGGPGSMGEQYYFYLLLDDGAINLTSSAQVVLNTPGHSRFVHPVPMECAPSSPGLLCHTHPASVVFSTPTSWSVVSASSAQAARQATRRIPSDLTDVAFVQNSLHVEDEGDPNDQGTRWKLTDESQFAPGQDPEVDPGDTCLTANEAGKISISRTNPICNWHNYRLQVQVSQPAFGTRPAVWESSPLPDTSIKVPIVGRVRKVAPVLGDKTSAWFLELPALYLGGQSLSFCTTGRTPLPGSLIKSEIIRNNDRESTIRLVVQSGVMAAFLNETAHAFSGPCAESATKSVDLGAVSGVKDLLLPSDVQLARSSMSSPVFQFTGTHLENVDALMVGDSGVPVTAWHVGVSLFVNMESAKNEQEEMLFFQVAGQKIPVSACWDQVTTSTVAGTPTPKTEHVCGAVIVQNTSTSKAANVAAVKATESKLIVSAAAAATSTIIPQVSVNPKP